MVFRRLVHQARTKVDAELMRADTARFLFNKVQSLETLEPVSAFFDYKLITRRGYFEFELGHVSQVQWPPMMVEAYLLTSEQDRTQIDSLVVCTLKDPGRELLFPSFRYGQLTLESSSLEVIQENMSVNRILTLSNSKGTKFSLKCPDKIQIQYWKGQLEKLFPRRMSDMNSLYSTFSSEGASSMRQKTSSSYTFSTRNSDILSDTSFEGLNILKPLASPLSIELSEFPSLSVGIPPLRKPIKRRSVSKRFTKTPRLSLIDLSMGFADAPELKAFMDTLKGEDQSPHLEGFDSPCILKGEDESPHVDAFDSPCMAFEGINNQKVDESETNSPVFLEATTLLPQTLAVSTSEEDLSDSQSDIDSESYYSDDDSSDSVLDISSQFEFCDVTSVKKLTSIPMDSALSALQSNPGISLETLYQAEVNKSSSVSLPALPISLPPCPPVPRSSDRQTTIQIVNDKQEVDDMDREFQSQETAKKLNDAESSCISVASPNMTPKQSRDRIATSKQKDPTPTHKYGLSIDARYNNLKIASSDPITPSQSNSKTSFNALPKVQEKSETVETIEEEHAYTRPALKRKSSAKRLVGVFKTLAAKLKKPSSSSDELTPWDDTRSNSNSLDSVPYELRDPIQAQSTTMSDTEFCERLKALSMQNQQHVPAPQVNSLFIDRCSSTASSALEFLKEANSVPMRRGKASRAEKALSKISEEFVFEGPKSFIDEEEPELGIASADAMPGDAEGQEADLCEIDSTHEGSSNKMGLQTSISTTVTAVGQCSSLKTSSLSTIALPELESQLDLEEDMLFKSSRSFASSIGTAVGVESNNATSKHGHTGKLSNGASLRTLFGSDSSFSMSRKSSVESALTDVSSIPALEPEPVTAPALSTKVTFLKTQAMVSKWDSMSWVRISESLVDVLICVSSKEGSISCTVPLAPSRHSLNVIAEEDEDSEEEIVPMPSPVLTLSLNSRNSHLMRRTAFDVHLRTDGDTTYLFRLLSSRSADEFMNTVSMGSTPTSSAVVQYRKYY